MHHVLKLVGQSLNFWTLISITIIGLFSHKEKFLINEGNSDREDVFFFLFWSNKEWAFFMIFLRTNLLVPFAIYAYSSTSSYTSQQNCDHLI